MRIARAQVDAMLAHARSGYPYEVCGVMLGRGPDGARRVEEAVAVANRETEAPRVRYEIAPEDQIRIQREARDRGWEVIGYYHSHPDHPARPSETDRRIASLKMVFVLVMEAACRAVARKVRRACRNAGKACHLFSLCLR